MRNGIKRRTFRDNFWPSTHQPQQSSGLLKQQSVKNLTQNIFQHLLFRPAFAPLYSNQYHHQHSSSLASSQHNQWNSSSQNYSNLHINHHLQNNKRDFDGLSTSSSRKEKRQYKKRKHKAPREVKPSKMNLNLLKRQNSYVPSLTSVEPYDGLYSSDDEDIHNNQLVASESEEEGIYPFRRNRNCDYYKVSKVPSRLLPLMIDPSFMIHSFIFF